MSDVREAISKAIVERGEATGAVVTTQGQLVGIGFCPLVDLDGDGEYQLVNECLQDFPGDADTVSVFRWPLGTMDSQIASDLEQEIENTLRSVSPNPSGSKPARPVRYCWGHLGGEVTDEHFLNEVSARLSRAKERIELELDTTKPMPVNLLLTLHHHGNGVEWGLSVTIHPRKLWRLYEQDHLPHHIKDASEVHIQEYGSPPKAIMNAAFVTPLPLRTVTERFTAAVSNVAAWSRPHQDDGQLCHWLF